MKMILEKEDYLKNQIRDIIAVNPLASVRSMQGFIENNTGQSLSKNYTAKLMGKVRKQALVESDRKKTNERLAEVRERNRAHIEYLERMLYWKPECYHAYGIDEPKLKEKMAAIKLISQLDLALLKAEFMVGMFGKGAEIELKKSQSMTIRMAR